MELPGVTELVSSTPPQRLVLGPTLYDDDGADGADGEESQPYPVPDELNPSLEAVLPSRL